MQTGLVSDRTVDIYRGSAAPTHQVMMVVVDSILVESGRPRRLNAADQAPIREGTEGVIDGLARHGPDASSDVIDDLVGCGVRVC